MTFTKTRIFDLAVVAATVLQLGSSSARAADADTAAAGAASFGTGSTWTVVGAADFTPRDASVSNVHIDNDFALAQTNSSSSGQAVAQLRLPNGALIESLCMEAEDIDDTSEVILNLWVFEFDPAPTLVMSEFISSGIPDTPGWITVCAHDLGIPFHSVADFNGNSADGTLVYSLHAVMTGGDASKRLANAAVRWRRQISPAPVTATFGDVPKTHLFFQQIEALAASGITGGCGGDNFCPGDPLTRGQMAAFLAKALGLHWAN